jgi:catechol 2,3-dioxygenase-like lactoylglutathione lyase family enzyme
VVGVDHLVIRVSDYPRSKDFYGRLFAFLGFDISDEYTKRRDGPPAHGSEKGRGIKPTALLLVGVNVAAIAASMTTMVTAIMTTMSFATKAQVYAWPAVAVGVTAASPLAPPVMTVAATAAPMMPMHLFYGAVRSWR